MKIKENLFAYYQRELEFLRKFGKQFALAHPATAGNLAKNSTYNDPFTDRLIEAIGLLNAKNHLKLDAEFSKTCASLLECIAPESLAPIPATSIVQFTPEIKDSIVNIPAKTVLTSLTPMNEPCYFSTGYDVECHPLEITKAHLSTHMPLSIDQLYTSTLLRSSLCIKLESAVKFDLSKLRFFIRAQPEYAYMLYELLFKHTQKIILARHPDDKNPVILNKNYLKAEGFDREQCLLPHHSRRNREHLLLSEFLNCPEKFLFFSIIGLEKFFIQQNNNINSDYGSHSIYIYILFDSINNSLEKYLTPDFLALNCTPIINIFPAISEPVHITHKQNEYLLQARLDHHPIATEIYSIQKIFAYNTKNQEVLFCPIYDSASNIDHFYHPIRRTIPQSEIYLAFSTYYPELFYEQEWIATANILCTNRHLVNQLPYGGHLPCFYFTDEIHKSRISNIKLLTPFTAIQDISLDHENIIHRFLSYLFIYQSPKTLINLQNTFQILASQNENQLQFLSAISRLDYYPAQHRLNTQDISYPIINGTDIYLQVDTEKISSSQIFFSCAILERYFGFQADINAYTSLVLVNRQREEIYRWPLRCGETELKL